jgi:hypothetical protein
VPLFYIIQLAWVPRHQPLHAFACWCVQPPAPTITRIHICITHLAQVPPHQPPHAGVFNGLHLRSLLFAFTLILTISIAASWFSHAFACSRSRPRSFVRWRECHITSRCSHLHAGVYNDPHIQSFIFAFTLTITFPIAASLFSHALACMTLTPCDTHRSFAFALSLIRSSSICHVVTATRSH